MGCGKVVAAVVTAGVAIATGGVGAAVAEGVGAAAGSVEAATISGAVSGAIGGAAGAAVSGGNIGQGILFGGLSGGVGGAVGSELTGTAKEPGPLADSPSLAKGIGGAVGQTTGALASGQPVGKALETGLIGGTATGLSNYIVGSGTDTASTLERGAISSGISQGLGSALGLNQTQAPTQTASTFVPSTTTTTGQGGVTPGSQALGQALRVDPTATLGGGDQTSTPQNVWNVASLRVKDETGA
jgi:hypothetical protein